MVRKLERLKREAPEGALFVGYNFGNSYIFEYKRHRIVFPERRLSDEKLQVFGSWTGEIVANDWDDFDRAELEASPG